MIKKITAIWKKFFLKKMPKHHWKKEKTLQEKLLMFVPVMILPSLIISIKPILLTHFNFRKKNCATAKIHTRKGFSSEISMRFFNNYTVKNFPTITWLM